MGGARYGVWGGGNNDITINRNTNINNGNINRGNVGNRPSQGGGTAWKSDKRPGKSAVAQDVRPTRRHVRAADPAALVPVRARGHPRNREVKWARRERIAGQAGGVNVSGAANRSGAGGGAGGGMLSAATDRAVERARQFAWRREPQFDVEAAPRARAAAAAAHVPAAARAPGGGGGGRGGGGRR